MSTIQITCDNCGAKYKLPETFNSPKAKCQKCGSVIDVAGQRHAGDGAASATATAAASPAAAARPAVDRSKSKPAAASTAKASGRGGLRRGKSGDDDGDSAASAAGSGRSRREPKPKDNKPLIFGGIGLLVLVIVVVVFLMQGGGDQTNSEQSAQTPPANPSVAADKPAEKPKANNANTTDPAANAGNPEAGKGTESAPDAPKPTVNATPAEASAPTEKVPADAPRWMRLKIQTMDQVADPKTYGDVPWDRIDAARKEQLQTWAADFAAGGRAGLNAEAAMREAPYQALFGIVDHLRGLNYKEPFDTMTGYALNRFLTDVTGGLQAGFIAAELDETIDPRKAEWNSITVRTWLQVFSSYKTEAEFLASVKERKAKAAKDDK